MSRVKAFTLVRLVVAMMVLECILTIFLPGRPSEPFRTHVSEKNFAAVVWTAFFTGSEVEKPEGFADKVFSIQIADLQENIFFLSKVHATPGESKLFSYYGHPPSLLTLLCILMI
jgi:hypothetical protein